MRHGDLFSGIGGFALAARWMGWETKWFSEIDPFASRVLKKHWPGTPNLGDIRAIDYSRVAPVNVITAGFPCQPHSVAGKGLASNDHRDLSDEVIRAIRDVRPQLALLENVPGLRRSEGGAFFRRFLGRIAAIGYDAEWVTLSASDVGAPHPRDRVWIVAYPDSQRAQIPDQGGQPAESVIRWDGETRGAGGESTWERTTQPCVWGVVDGIHNRLDRLRALGNAIVPQCAYALFRSITLNRTGGEPR